MRKNFGSSSYWVIAEIAKISEKNGNRYVDLVDSDQGLTTALMSGYIWPTTYAEMVKKVGADLTNILKAGNKVLLRLKIEFHPIYGLKLNILEIDPTYSYGEIEKLKQQTINSLKFENYYNLQKQLHLPVISKRIALIGSPGTSGYRDFMNDLRQNPVHRNFIIKEFSTAVQGDGAAAQIIQALREARQYDVDVIVLIRGGGSPMDLNVFNDYDLAKEICLTKIPIITGIGHESDEVVADLVSRLNCITPTAAAKKLYVQIGLFIAELGKAFDAVKSHSIGQYGVHRDEFNHLSNYLVHHSKQLIHEYNHELQNQSHNLQVGFLNMVNLERAQLELLVNKAKTISIATLVLLREVELTSSLDRIVLISKNQVTQSKITIANIEDLLKVLNPENLLNSGYTISTVDAVDINTITANLIGKQMRTLTSNSIITSTINDIKKTKK